jgi:rod shape determining protein RodA
MNPVNYTVDSSPTRRLLDALSIDPVLLVLLGILTALGMALLYSASGSNVDLIMRQLTRLSLGFFLFIVVANVPLRLLKSFSVWLYLSGVLLLLAVMFFGEVGKGAQRWLDLGIIRFQPSEILKLAVPMMVASYLADRTLPIGFKDLFVSVILVLIPVMLIARQPDLGTAILVGSAGAFVLFLAGVRWRIMFSLMFLFLLAAPLLWKFALHDYQRSRILTMFDPESDPLGSGYHIIQSKIAIGSGGVYGKGWLNGTQSQLDFIPERSTDFIFSVIGEEFGFFGGVVLILLYTAIIFRGLYIASRAKDNFGRLVAGAISLTFFVYLFVNIGMVSGMLPVVGVPLPLISYGGTSMVTLLTGFGLIMSIRSAKRFMG